MVDYKRYLEKKEKGLADLVKINNSFAFFFKKYDSETGEELTPEVQAMGRDELETQKTEFQSQIADIDVILAEMDSLEG